MDLARLCRESGVGAEVRPADFPMRPSTRRAAEALGLEALSSALHGGEEYELLFTVRPGKEKSLRRYAASRGVKISHVGVIVKGERVSTLSETGRQAPLPDEGWKHFA